MKAYGSRLTTLGLIGLTASLDSGRETDGP
jgi:hypothetical protein